jgi:hypothetical protein
MKAFLFQVYDAQPHHKGMLYQVVVQAETEVEAEQKFLPHYKEQFNKMEAIFGLPPVEKDFELGDGTIIIDSHLTQTLLSFEVPIIS